MPLGLPIVSSESHPPVNLRQGKEPWWSNSRGTLFPKSQTGWAELTLLRTWAVIPIDSYLQTHTGIITGYLLYKISFLAPGAAQLAKLRSGLSNATEQLDHCTLKVLSFITSKTPPTIEATIILWTLGNKRCSEMRNQIEERHGQLGHQKVTFSGEGQTRNQPTMLEETARTCAASSSWLGEDKKKISAESLQLSAGTTPTRPVRQRKTSSRAFKFKCFQTESVPRWLAQGHTNPEVPSGRSGLESRLTTPQTCHHPYNTLWFQGVEVPGGGGKEMEMGASGIFKMHYLFSYKE